MTEFLIVLACFFPLGVYFYIQHMIESSYKKAMVPGNIATKKKRLNRRNYQVKNSRNFENSLNAG